ncbi:GGDEF domain-containing protein [Candidatus Pacearchaeota archaeon]|nr:GGDEF domain-containing protein [Candidatus Pacearchaeota archaeon]
MEDLEFGKIICEVFDRGSIASINEYIVPMDAFDKDKALSSVMYKVALNGTWGKDEIKYLHQISIENNNLIRNLATRDSLTGLYNRIELDSAFKREQSKMSRSPENNPYSSSLLMIDIDHFKNFNDTYGHVAGDRVLKDLSGIITNHLRDTDITFRFGGGRNYLYISRNKCK